MPENLKAFPAAAAKDKELAEKLKGAGGSSGYRHRVSEPVCGMPEWMDFPT